MTASSTSGCFKPLVCLSTALLVVLALATPSEAAHVNGGVRRSTEAIVSSVASDTTTPAKLRRATIVDHATIEEDADVEEEYEDEYGEVDHSQGFNFAADERGSFETWNDDEFALSYNVNSERDTWDPFKSDAFRNAKSMDEKCQVMQRSFMRYGYSGGESYYEEFGDFFGSSGMKKCTSASENARGSYSSTVKSCTFTFHQLDGDQEGLDDFELSTACGDTNAIPHATFKEYARNWPDECVGDFSRCYTVGRDEQIFFKFLCEKNKNIPAGATHVSVDCTEDKASNVERSSSYFERGTDVFKSSSLVNAKSMEEKCKLIQRADSYSYDFYGYDDGRSTCSRSDFRDYFSESCSSASENARGTYCANTKACTFAFHQINEDEVLGENEVSTLCGESNVMEATTFKEYPKKTGWPDECVGDMSRCYIIGRDDPIFLAFLCDKNKSIPDGATHMSVDCTEDKISAREKFEKAPVMDELV